MYAQVGNQPSWSSPGYREDVRFRVSLDNRHAITSRWTVDVVIGDSDGLLSFTPTEAEKLARDILYVLEREALTSD